MDHGSAPSLQLVAILVVAACCVVASAPAAPLSSCISRDRDSLLEFKDKVLSDPAGQLASWQSGGNCCAFKGVTCNAGGEVVSLTLQGSNLTGTLPAIEEGELPALQVLWLQGNRFNGAIPPSLARLISLKDLRLGGYEDASTSIPSQLSGSIPLAFQNLTNLETLSIRLSSISGSIPPALGSLKFLKTLLLDQNHLSGTIPPSLNVGQQLTSLALNNNTLSGRIPASLSGFPAASFAGNPSLYGPPLEP